MKVPCTECKQPCRRKVVNRGVENLHRIYYKCETCKHKVGWEDELLAGVPPWTKEQALNQKLQEQDHIEQPQEQPQQPAGLALQADVPVPNSGDDFDVQIVFERTAPPTAQQRTSGGGAQGDVSGGAATAAAATAGAEAAATATAAAAVGQQQQQDCGPSTAAKSRQPGLCMPAQHGSHSRMQNRQAVGALQPDPGAFAPSSLERPANGTAGPGQRPHPHPHQHQHRAQAQAPVSPPTVTAKRKFDDAFEGAAGDRPPGKRVVQEAPPGAPGGVFAARSGPVAGAARANGVYGGAAAAVGGAAAAPTGAGLGEGVFVARGARVPPLARGTAGSPGSVHPAGRPAVPPPYPAGATAATAAAGGPARAPTISPGRVRVNEGLEDAQMQIRQLRRELAVANARTREEAMRAQNEAAAAERLRMKQEPLERELRELRGKYQELFNQNRQLSEQLAALKARERAQQQQPQAAAAAHAAAAAQRAQQRAAQQQAAAAQQAAAQEFAKQQYNYWVYHQQQQPHFNGHTDVPLQTEYDSTRYAGGAGRGGGAGPGPSGHGRTSGGGGGGGAGPDGGGGGAAPPPPPAEARDDPATLAFATAFPPSLDESISVRVLKQFLSEAGAEANARLCAEKTELLALARERLNAWEIRRAVACSRLVSQAAGDRALFRLDPGAVQRSAFLRSYRDLMLRLHPDKNPGDEMATQAFQYLQQAYNRLNQSAASGSGGGS